MPIYKVNGEIYDIPASKQEAFEKRYPDASVSYINAGDTYEIPLNKRDAFLKRYPDAYLTSLEVPSTEQPKAAYSPTHNYGDGSDTNARVRMFNDKPNPPLNTVRGFGKAAAQSLRGLGAGVQNLWGEFTNIFTGSSRDDANALAEFDRMMSEGIDVNDATDGAWTHLGRELRTGALEFLPGWMIKGWKQNVHDQAEKMKVLGIIRDVLSETGGDVGKARALLQQRAKDQSYGDRQMQAAAETMGEMKPTEGFGAWLGENMVQMIPSASALLIGAITRSPAAAKVVGGLGIGAMTAATSGQSMYEARQAGASDYETRKTGVVDGMIEVITEKIPFDRYTKRIVGKAKKEVAEQMARALSDKNSPAREELQDLLTRANRLLGGKLFSKKTAQEYIADIMAEGASEFTAEALQTMSSIIYEEPENYPEFSEIMSNGFQGLLAGAFMGSVLGGSSLALGSQQNKQRRKEQGFVKIGLIDNGDNGMDIGEIAAYDPERQMFTITDGINSYEVGRNKIKQTFDYTYEEFESARYRQLEDEAIDNGAVTDGQMSASEQRLNKERGRFDVLLSNYGLSDEEKAEVFASIERGDIPALPEQSDLSLWEAAGSYADAYERNADMQRARYAKALSERSELSSAIEKKVGKFWQDETETVMDNGFSAVEPKMVEFGTLADGRNVYIISGVNEDGEVAAVTEDGERLFVNHAMMPNGTRIISLDEYLDERLAQQRSVAEQERMSTENAERVNDVRQQVSLGMEVNLGTQEAPIMGTVLELMPANEGVLVQTEQGVAQLSWDKVADVLNVGAASMTDLEIATKDAADILESENAWKEVTARTEQEVALASSAEEVAAVASEDAEPLPLKQDGSVDQTTLWNKSPERWARWNDEQRQDGGVNSINYINNALAKAQKDLDSVVKAYDKETDFEAREAMEEGIRAKQERVARLSALQQSYLPENAQEQAAAQVAQETAGVQSPATQAEPSQTAQALPAPEQTIYDLFSDESLSEDEIEAYIDANVAGSQSDLDKHLNKAPKMGRDMEKYKADKAKHEEKTRELTAIRDHWRQVRAYLNPSTVEMDMEPQNALEAAAKELTRKDGISLLPESFRHHTGYGRGEQVAFLSILRKKENGGMTLEAAGERLMADYPEFFDQNDPNAGLNSILEVLQSAASSSDLYNYINNAREDAARQEADAVRSAVIQQVEDAKKQTNVPYHLSEEVDENGRQFVLTSNGSLSFGEIGTDTGLTPAPILLSEGLITNPATNDGYGLVHIEARHGEQIRNAGYSSVVDFIEEVARNYDVIREGRNRDGNQTYMLQLTDKHNNTLMVELSGDGTYWNINTAGIFKTSYGANRKEVYNRHTTDRQSAETAEVSQDAEQGGTQSSSSMNTPTSSSIDKDSNNPAISNESEENVDGFTSTLDEDMPDFESMSDEEVKRMAIEAVVPETERQRFQDEKRNTLKDRIREWEQKLGAKVKVMDSIDDVTNSQAKAQIEKGGEVWGWFETSTGEVCIYLPDFMSLSTSAALSEIDKTYIHEIVSHKGLRGLLGEDAYGELCDMVWEAMTEEEQQSWMQYPGVNGNTRAAADEFIAHFAENVDYNDNRTLWDKILDFIKDMFNSVEIPTYISNESLADLLRQSYRNLAKSAAAIDINANKQAEGNTLFRVPNGSLVGIHNISEEKLRKVIKQGGSANPSTAVIDIERQAFDSYGDISFIMPSSLVDAGTGRNAGTFTADAWTPTYPQVTKRFSDDKLQRAYWRDVSAIPEEMSHEVRMAFNSWLDDRDASGLAYMFLHERGEAPEMVRVAAKFPQDIKDKLSAILGENRSGLYKLSNEEKQAVLDLYIQENFGGNREEFDKSIADRIKRIEDRLSTGKVPSFVEKRITLDLQWMKEHAYDYDELSKFVNAITADIRHAGEVNDAATTNRALDYIKDNGLEKEFDKWKESLNDRYGIKQYLFDGYTPSGDQRWLPNTVENASRLMNKQGLAGATGMAVSFNRFVATLAPKKKTLSEIRASKDRLVEDDKLVDDFREKWSEVFFDLGVKCQPDAKGYEDYGLERLTEAAQKKNPGAYLKKEYGVELSQEDLQKLSEMIKAIKTEFPARYFETKFQRPLYLNEFAAAVMPMTTSEDIKQAVSEAGLPIFEYDSSVEGSRKEATLKATEGEGIRFRTAPSDRVLSLFNQARAGELGGKPISIGSLTKEGKEYLERISGIKLKENVSFVLNPSDLNHIYNDHYGKNEKDTGNNIPLNDYDIRRLVDVIAFPTRVVFGEDKQGRKVFYFLSETPSGTYNLMEIYANKKGNLTAKTYYKTKKGATQRVMELESLLSTSETYSGATLPDAKIPILFNIANQEEDNTRFRITPEQDAAYMKAVEAGDMETAQRMVNEAAKLAMPNTAMIDRNGYPKIFYHNTDAEFTAFGAEYNGTATDAGWLGDGFYFYGDPAEGDLYGRNKMRVFLNIEEPYYATSEENKFLAEANSRKESIAFSERLKEEWYDGVYYNGDLRQEVVAFYPSQIKSADPVTYDDKGNVISLSERFNKEMDDIRFRTTEITPEVREEMAEIKRAAERAGTYLKAPNGADTNLTAEQWALVRTKAFKAWFGDWEKAARIQKLRNSEPVMMDGNEHEGKYELNRESAQRYILDELGDTYTIADTNERIKIVKKGAKKVTSHSMNNDAHMRSIAIIPEIIKSAIFITEMTADKADAQYDSYRYYVCGLEYAGESYTVKMTVGVKNGDYYYDHTLTDIEKGKLLDMIESQQGVSREGFTPTGNESDPSYALSDIKDKKLVSILQTNASKVVDANGEPMVVWRASRYGKTTDYTVFEKDKTGGRGFFFTNKESAIERYGGENLRAFFLNITNPDVSNDFNVLQAEEKYTPDNDGVIFAPDGTEGINYEVKAFEPSQIKSATDNTGEFSADNNDIRFRTRYDVNTNPTEAQKKAGNYKMGHLRLDGYNITIENPKGSVRRGTDSKGNEWENTLNNDYGYIRGTEGVDGDHIDVYLSDNPAEGNVFVIDQINPETREFDEHKVMYGFNSAEEAREAYLANFSEGWNGLGTITEVSKDEFKKWIDSSHRKTKPFSEYKSVKTMGGQSESYNEEVFFYGTGTPTENVVARGLELSGQDAARLAGDIYSIMPADIRKRVSAEALNNGMDLQKTIFKISASLAEKESLSDEETAFAKSVADILEQRLLDDGVEMTRPLTTSEALWMLWRNSNPVGEDDVFGAARRAVVADNLGMSTRFRAADKRNDSDNRSKQFREATASAAADAYNRSVSFWKNRLKESYVDNMDSVNILVEAIEKASGKAAQGWEDIRLTMNQLSSKGLSAMEKFIRDYLHPMWDAVEAIMKKMDIDKADVERYIMLESGLERNEVFAKRDAKAKHQDEYDRQIRSIEGMEVTDEEKAALKVKAKNTLDRRLAAVDAGTDATYKKMRERDYGAVMAQFAEYAPIKDQSAYGSLEEYNRAKLNSRRLKYSTVEEAESAAWEEINAFRQKAGEELIDNLWKRINAATKATLKQQYEANMLSKAQYDHIRGMFKYYVPMRGFADNTAEDMYSYYANGQNDFAAPVLKAKGRTTMAESPLGHIGAMASSGIAQGLKNEAKLALYYFVLNRPNDLISVDKTWYVDTGRADEEGKAIFEAKYPPMTGALSEEKARADYEKWQNEMKELEKQGKAVRGSRKLDLKNSVIHITPSSAKEHTITVKVGGEEITMFINGNPRAAQAVNGLLNIEASDKFEGMRKYLRFLSSVNTSFNPEFWMTNLQRDMLFTAMAISSKEDAQYNKAFQENYWKAWKAVTMVRKDKNGTLGDSHVEQLFKEFVENGGPTGYTKVIGNEEWEKTMNKYLSRKDRPKVESIRKAFDALQSFSEGIEQVSRFAAYMTSREMGRSVQQSISDAKEVTVNFNRKGSGQEITKEEADRLTDENGQPLSELSKFCIRMISKISPYGRGFLMFFNASVQGLNSFVRLTRNNPKAMSIWASGYLMLGILNASLHAMLDDDDEYLDIPDYERRTSLLLGGNGAYFKWALPQEARAFYALGDLFVNRTLDRMPHQNVVWEATKILFDVAPLNPTEGVAGVLPPFFATAVELWTNKDYKGAKIRKDMAYLSDEAKKGVPEYTKTFSGTSEVAVALSRAINWLSGGDYATSGYLDGFLTNPAVMQHVVESQLGGTLRTINKALDTIWNIGGLAVGSEDAEFTVRNTPFLNRLLTINDERYRNSHTTDLYKHYKGVAANAKRREKEYSAAHDSENLNRLRSSEDYAVFQIYQRHKKVLDMYDKQLKLARNEQERRLIMQRQDAERKRMIEEISRL